MSGKLVNFNDVKAGDLMALVTFVKVANVQPSTKRIGVTTVDGDHAGFDIQGQELVERMHSADRFLRTEEMTKTQLAEKLVSSFNTPFTVTFQKSNGDTRVLRGRLVSPEPLLGRSHVEDLDVADGKHNLRLVDHRTLQSLVVDGVKYELKD